MGPILTPIVIVGALGLVLGLVLAIAARVFAVKVNEKAEKIRECLPGANCGGCGYSGCDGYAAALADGRTDKTGLCSPGGHEVAQKVADVLGVEAGYARQMTAVVLCQGNSHNVKTKINYVGASSCKMATQLFGGPKNCTYGCLGFGDCVKACPYEAIFICGGIARIDPGKCKACRKCMSVCPRGLIELYPVNEKHTIVFCKNGDKGSDTRKACLQGCLACTRCVRICKNDAITITDNHAHIDSEKCTGCGACIPECPAGAINHLHL